MNHAVKNFVVVALAVCAFSLARGQDNSAPDTLKRSQSKGSANKDYPLPENDLSNPRLSDLDRSSNKQSATAQQPEGRFEMGGAMAADGSGGEMYYVPIPMTSLEKIRQNASQKESNSIQLASEVRLVMKQLDPTDVAERDRLRRKLRQYVMEAFKARLDMQRMEVAILEMKLNAMNRKLEEQETKAAEIVEHRIDDLLNPDLQWDENSQK